MKEKFTPPASFDEAVQLQKAAEKNFEGFLDAASQIRERFHSKKIELCSIVNAKSGNCRQDCSFCAQSTHHNTNIDQYPLISRDKMVEAARQAADIGAKCFGIVTSGAAASNEEIDEICEAIWIIKAEGRIIPDASLGILTEKRAKRLKEAGLVRYHHNLETSRSFFPKVCTTHSYQKRVDTVKIAKEAGLEVCCGGIFGLGEDFTHRIELGLTLKELDVNSVPLNFLIPVPGTKLAGAESLSVREILMTVALFRFLLPQKHIKVCGGREKNLGERQREIFRAGANGMMIGGYLTQGGCPPEEDLKMLEELGLDVQGRTATVRA